MRKKIQMPNTRGADAFHMGALAQGVSDNCNARQTYLTKISRPHYELGGGSNKIFRGALTVFAPRGKKSGELRRVNDGKGE
jgi:hypothetical protein